MKWFVVLCAWGISFTAHCQNTVTLYYYERPPFLVRHPDGTASGLIGSRISQALDRAGIPFRWTLTPANRQLHLIHGDSEDACGVGWYKTDQRAGFAQFSHPIYRDRGTVVIANFQISASRYETLAEMLADKSVVILIKDGLTYGPAVAKLLATTKARIDSVTIEQPQMVRLIASGRAQLMFATREEAEMLLTGSEETEQGVHLLSFPDLPKIGEPRYLMCSRRLGPDILARIDTAIDALGPP